MLLYETVYQDVLVHMFEFLKYGVAAAPRLLSKQSESAFRNFKAEVEA